MIEKILCIVGMCFILFLAGCFLMAVTVLFQVAIAAFLEFIKGDGDDI